MQWEDRLQYFEQIRAKIAALPGVVGAGISTNATPPANGMDTRFEIFGQVVPQEQQASTNFVSPEYFAVLHIPLAAGRMWTQAETLRGARLALVNQTFARQYWPKQNAVVRRTGEFGVRMGLGAQPTDVLRLVFTSIAASVDAGVTAGLILSLALARVWATWTQETSRDPRILVAVMVLLSVAAGAACLIPARRASSIDPMAAIRYE
jgi:hypothetical protein